MPLSAILKRQPSPTFLLTILTLEENSVPFPARTSPSTLFANLSLLFHEMRMKEPRYPLSTLLPLSGLASRLANVVRPGITNQSAMKFPPSPVSRVRSSSASPRPSSPVSPLPVTCQIVSSQKTTSLSNRSATSTWIISSSTSTSQPLFRLGNMPPADVFMRGISFDYFSHRRRFPRSVCSLCLLVLVYRPLFSISPQLPSPLRQQPTNWMPCSVYA
jgi:hypothetical protein